MSSGMERLLVWACLCKQIIFDPFKILMLKLNGHLKEQKVRFSPKRNKDDRFG